MKKHIYLIIVLFGAVACSNAHSDNKDEAPDSLEQKKVTEKAEPVEVSLDQLVGTWECMEVRLLLDSPGTKPPGGTILLGITADSKLAFSTGGEEELAFNLEMAYSEFSVKDKQICATDVNDITFKSMLQRPCLPVYLINDEELIFGKGVDPTNTSEPLVYHYYKKIK